MNTTRIDIRGLITSNLYNSIIFAHQLATRGEQITTHTHTHTHKFVDVCCKATATLCVLMMSFSFLTIDICISYFATKISYPILIQFCSYN